MENGGGWFVDGLIFRWCSSNVLCSWEYWVVSWLGKALNVSHMASRGFFIATGSCGFVRLFFFACRV